MGYIHDISMVYSWDSVRVSIVMGVPQNGWFIMFIVENSQIKWMITGCTSISTNLDMVQKTCHQNRTLAQINSHFL